MRIGDPIIQQISRTINNIEKQFGAIELIDNFKLTVEDPVKLFIPIVKLLKSITESEVCQLYFEIDEQLELYYSYPSERNEYEENIEDLSASFKNGSKVFLNKKHEKAILILKIDSKFFPNTVISIVDKYFGRKISIIHDKEFLKYCTFLTEKFDKKLDRFYQDKFLQNYRGISEKLLIDQARLSEEENYNNEITIEESDDPWVTILNSVAQYFPNWGPFQYGKSQPLMQILTIQKGRQFLDLKAETQFNNNESLTVVSKNLQLDKAWTICGLLLDHEDRSEYLDYLLVNPHDFKSRYASLMFPVGELPKSELAIPIRNSFERIIVIFNFEHKDVDFFTDYHIQMLIQMVRDVESQVKYLLHVFETKIDVEKELRYLMLRIANNLTSTQTHKLKNDFGTILSAINEAKWEVENGTDKEAISFIVEAVKGLNELKMNSLDFTVNIEDYVSFRPRKISTLVKDSVPDSAKRASLEGDNIELKLEDNFDHIEVFCSGIAREHIHNLLQNAMDQFINRRRNDENFIGRIDLDVKLLQRSNKDLNVYTYDLVAFNITDNGGGIDKSKEAVIFNRGWTSKSKNGGQGFGLSAAKEYMEKIGGKLLLLENVPGKGATFSMQFPVYTEALHEPMAEALNINGVR